MRVVLVNKYYGRRGGAESVVLQTQRLLEEAGHEVVPFAMSYEGGEPTPWSEYFLPAREYFAGSRVRRARDSLAAIYSFDARRRIGRVARLTQPDVAHLHNVYHQLTLSVVDELRSLGVPIVMTLHDYKPACPNYQLLTHDGLCQRCVGGAYWNAVRHRCLKGSLPGSAIAAAEAYLNRVRGQYRKIDLYLSPSAFLRDVMVRAGLPRERIDVLPNAVPVGEPTQPVPERPRFVYFGRLSPEKGLETLLDAAGRLSSGAEILVLGSGPLQEALRRRAEREGLPVRFGGFASSSEVQTELCRCTAALLPSRWYENCPVSVLEAGALGVPTIASEIGGIPELISSGVNGILVPPGDAAALATALDELARDPRRAASLGRAAYERVLERHAENRYGDALVERYEWVVSHRSPVHV